MTLLHNYIDSQGTDSVTGRPVFLERTLRGMLEQQIGDYLRTVTRNVDAESNQFHLLTEPFLLAYNNDPSVTCGRELRTSDIFKLLTRMGYECLITTVDDLRGFDEPISAIKITLPKDAKARGKLLLGLSRNEDTPRLLAAA